MAIAVPSARQGASMLLTLCFALQGGCEHDPGTPGDLVTGEAAEVSSCNYTNRFSSMIECKEYTGSGWTMADAEGDCESELDSTFAAAQCSRRSHLGTCELEESTNYASLIIFPGDDASRCQEMETGCETFAAGSYEFSGLCENVENQSSEPSAPQSATGGAVFQPMEYLCKPSIDSREGVSEGADVCTWQSIGGCTEPGRKFEDYASCDPVMTQRPFFPVPPASFQTPDDDPIRLNESFLAELAWVKEESEACGCVCCHTTGVAPQGAAAFDTSTEGIWTDSFSERGLAIAAGWIDSTALGAHNAGDNNGFDRSQTGLPTTDPARMIRFFEAELARRGVSRDRFEGATPVGGPLYTQMSFLPDDCQNNEGVSGDGIITWAGGGARYIYILEDSSKSPGVPPNLDKPEGTIWKIDRAATASPLQSGIAYGELPDDTAQAVPVDGAAPMLEDGDTYYLYVLADIGSPITRCLFTYDSTTSMATLPPVATDPAWGQVCANDGDCSGITNYCAVQPGNTEGYCTVHCETTQACEALGVPEDWTCNALACDVEAFTWCGPYAEIAASNNFLKVCD